MIPQKMTSSSNIRSITVITNASVCIRLFHHSSFSSSLLRFQSSLQSHLHRNSIQLCIQSPFLLLLLLLLLLLIIIIIMIVSIPSHLHLPPLLHMRVDVREEDGTTAATEPSGDVLTERRVRIVGNLPQIEVVIPDQPCRKITHVHGIAQKAQMTV
jgi:hypothetical protein